MGQWWEQRRFPSHHLVIGGKELFKSWHDLRSTNGQVGWRNAAPESWSQDNEVIGFVLPGRLVWEEDVKLFLSREAGNFKSLVVQAVLLWSRIPISQNQSRERPGCSKELTEFLDGISVVGQGLLVVRQVPREGPKIEPTFVEDTRADEPPPLDGVEDANGKGFVNEDCLAKVAAELVSGH